MYCVHYATAFATKFCGKLLIITFLGKGIGHCELVETQERGNVLANQQTLAWNHTLGVLRTETEITMNDENN